MTVGRGIAAQRHPAGLTGPQVYPPIARGHADVALLRTRRLDVNDSGDVGAGRGHIIPSWSTFKVVKPASLGGGVVALLWQHNADSERERLEIREPLGKIPSKDPYRTWEIRR
jgi:hypothetical protein